MVDVVLLRLYSSSRKAGRAAQSPRSALLKYHFETDSLVAPSGWQDRLLLEVGEQYPDGRRPCARAVASAQFQRSHAIPSGVLPRDFLARKSSRTRTRRHEQPSNCKCTRRIMHEKMSKNLVPAQQQWPNPKSRRTLQIHLLGPRRLRSGSCRTCCRFRTGAQADLAKKASRISWG